MQNLNRVAADRRQGDRDTLIMLWFEETGLRRAEALRSISVQDIPHSKEIQKGYDNDVDFTVSVCGKSGERTVAVTPMLMEMTRDYIAGDRRAIVQRFSRRVGWTQPKEVFLSERGGPLGLNYWSNIMTRTFKEAGVENASGHRIRARFLTLLLENLIAASSKAGLDLDYEKILDLVADRAGHRSTASLAAYLKLALRRVLQGGRPRSCGNLHDDIELREKIVGSRPIQSLVNNVVSNNRTRSMSALLTIKALIQSADTASNMASRFVAAAKL